jgi:hypothetical protein
MFEPKDYLEILYMSAHFLSRRAKEQGVCSAN